MTRKSRGALLERGGGVKDLRLSDAAKLDYGSMAALELAGAGPVSGLPEPEPPSDPEGRADRGRTREPVSEHAPPHAQRGPREPHAEIAGAAGPRAPVGHAAVAAAPSVQLPPAAEAVNSSRPG
ncbi:MAG: hypothetical protein DYG92_01265, partial [Leptolyngbya sp. PLA1]|nr:hypothetical protein [Leptolyngbya sp. PLA1]